MRKHSARKWLHATLDLLPVVLIPVFMIYSHRHNVAENVPVADVQFKYESNEVNSIDDIVVDHIYIWSDIINYSKLSYTGSPLSFGFYGAESIYGFYDYNLDEVFIRSFDYFESYYWIYFEYSNTDFNLFIYTNLSNDEYVSLNCAYEDEFNFTNMLVTFSESDLELFKDLYNDNPNNWNLPQYTDYNVIENVTVDYSDNVMDVFLSDFNFTIEKYFNFSNVFNLNDVYSWVVTNIFNGSAPLILYSVWNIIAYEFIMDLLFLLYGLFMFFIDTCTNLMDRFYGNLSGRR